MAYITANLTPNQRHYATLTLVYDGADGEIALEVADGDGIEVVRVELTARELFGLATQAAGGAHAVVRDGSAFTGPLLDLTASRP